MVPERPIVEIAKSLELYLVARAMDDLTSPTPFKTKKSHDTPTQTSIPGIHVSMENSNAYDRIRVFPAYAVKKAME